MKPLSWMLVLLAIAFVAPACSKDNGCEGALTETKGDTDTVCKETGYDKSPFCTVCVAAGYYSTSGPVDCTCKLLAFDQPYCTFPNHDEALAGVRGAVAWANQSCATFTFGTGSRDGGADASDATTSAIDGEAGSN